MRNLASRTQVQRVTYTSYLGVADSLRDSCYLVVISMSTKEERQKEIFNVSPATLMVWHILMRSNPAPDIGERRRFDRSFS